MDTTFAGSGTVSLGDAAGRHPVVLGMPDGSVVSTGRTDRLLTRITVDGQIDATWGAGIPADIVNDVTLSETSRGVLVTGTDATSQGRLTLVRDDGKPDSTFGVVTGTVVLPQAVRGFAAVPAGDGYLGFAGVVPGIELPQIDVLRFTQRGHLASSARVTLPLVGDYGSAATVSSVTRTTLGTVVAVSTALINQNAPGPYPDHVWRWSYLLRFRDDGTLDTSWGNQGIAWAAPYGVPGAFSTSDITRQIAGLPDGRVAAIGDLNYLVYPDPISRPQAFVQLYTADGSHDASFGTDGVVLLRNPGDALVPRAITANVSGSRLLVAGVRVRSEADSTGVVATYEVATGALAVSFASSGYATVPRDPASVSLRVGQSQAYVGSHIASTGPVVSRLLVP